MNHLVVGMGQIGSAITQVFASDVETLDINSEPVKKSIDIMHVCFGYSKDFIREVKRYQVKYSPKLTIIYSTVPIGTTKKLKHTVHSPVEGRHPRLYSSVMMGTRFIGYNDPKDLKLANEVYRLHKIQAVPDSNWTEFLKLSSTAKYGINLVFAEYMNDVSKKLGMDYEFVKEWDMAYNQLYRKLKFHNYRKFVLEPPRGKIGGHCVVPNAFLLDDQFPHDMLKMIKEFL